MHAVTFVSALIDFITKQIMDITYLGHLALSIAYKSIRMLFGYHINAKEHIRADYMLIPHAHRDYIGNAIDIAKKNAINKYENAGKELILPEKERNT